MVFLLIFLIPGIGTNWLNYILPLRNALDTLMIQIVLISRIFGSSIVNRFKESWLSLDKNVVDNCSSVLFNIDIPLAMFWEQVTPALVFAFLSCSRWRRGTTGWRWTRWTRWTATQISLRLGNEKKKRQHQLWCLLFMTQQHQLNSVDI